MCVSVWVCAHALALRVLRRSSDALVLESQAVVSWNMGAGTRAQRLHQALPVPAPFAFHFSLFTNMPPSLTPRRLCTGSFICLQHWLTLLVPAFPKIPAGTLPPLDIILRLQCPTDACPLGLFAICFSLPGCTVDKPGSATFPNCFLLPCTKTVLSEHLLSGRGLNVLH